MRSARTMLPVALAALLALFSVPAAGQEGTGDGGSDESAAAAGDSTQASGPERKFLSSDGAIFVFEELRPGEGINGFWWEYDAAADLQRLLDEDRRNRPLDPLTDAFGFEVFAPESILALRDSVRAVADSILAKRVEILTRFDPKLTSRYVENRDTFEFVNELASPIPLAGGTLQASLTNTDSFNESTRKVKDGRNLNAAFNRRYISGITTSLSLGRNDEQQRRDATLESRSDGTSLAGRLLAERQLGAIGQGGAEIGLSATQTHYETEQTDGESRLFAPSWALRLKRPFGATQASLDYEGRTERGNRAEERDFPVLDDQGNPVLDELGRPVTERRRTETEDRNFMNKLDFGANGDLAGSWKYRLNGSGVRDQMQYIAQADSVAGRQETRTNDTGSVNAHVEGDVWDGLEMKLDGRVAMITYDYEVETAKFSETRSRSADSEILWTPRDGSRVTVKLGRERERRDLLTAQAGIVDKESAGLNWKQDITAKVDITANYDITLDSFVYDDKEANTGDRDLRNQRGVFTIRYGVTKGLDTSVRMDLRKNQTINVNPQKSRENKTDYTYLVNPTYTLRFGGNSINGEFNADARYAVYDFDEDRNFLNRRFSTRQRWQRAWTERVSSEILATYEMLDEGAYRPSEVDGVRRFAKSRETRRSRLETTLLYNPRSWLRARVTFRRDAEDQFAVESAGKERTGEYLTDELTFGCNAKKKFLKAIQLDLDASWSQKQGDRVTDVDRNFYVIRASLVYQPFKTTGAES